jgi:hypothetical protein
MEGITTKHRAPKTIDGLTDKANTETPKSRKAKNFTMKRKLANISDDEEEPLAYVQARMRMKEEEDSEEEYVDSEMEEKRALQKRIKREEAVVFDKEQGVFRPEKVKIEDGEDHSLTHGQKETIQIKDRNC